VTEFSDAESLRTALGEPDTLVWADLLIASQQDAAVLSEVFRFHPLTIEDCVSPVVDPAKIDDYGEYLFMVVQSLTPYVPNEELQAIEVEFYLGPNYVVSCRREQLPAIEHFRVRAHRREAVLEGTPDRLLHALLDAIVDEFLPVVDAVDETIDTIEEQILDHAGTSLLQQIMMVKRNALRLRRATTPQRDIMARLSRNEFPRLIRPESGIYFRDVYDHLVRVEYLIESVRDLADGALQTYLSVVSNRLNEVMRVLTAAATVFLPLTLVSGIYGMNFEENQLPAFGASWGFGAVVGGMVALGVALLAFFRYRRWI